MEWSTLKVIVAILSLTTLELFALHKGRNGTMLRIVIIAIAGLAGFTIAEFLK